MFSTLLERMIKVKVPDRNDPSKTVEINRYVIDKNEEPTAVVFGKFIPWTGPNGHGRLVDLAKKNFKNIVIVSPTREKSFDPKVDIFNDEQKSEIIQKATGLKFIRVDSSIPIRMFTRVIQAGIDRPIFIVGPDRINDFKRYFVEYNKNNEGTEDPKDKDFGKGEYFFAESRGKDQTSGTKVREALINNDKASFLKLTGYKEEMWNLMRQMLKDNKVVERVTFKFDNFYYLTEGGNVKVKGQSAHKIPMDQISAKQFDELKKEISDALKALNAAFQTKYKKPLFPNIDANIENGKLFSGSTRPFFTMTYDDYKKHKKYVGDMDLQYPEELEKELGEFLAANEGKKFGKMTYFGEGGASPTQYNTIFKSTVAPDLVENIQMDFEPTQWETGTPTEFATFAHYSDWEDIKANVKGAFSKLLMRALVSSKERLGDIAVMTPTGKISKSTKFEDPAMRKFSVDKGMRVAFEPVLDAKGNIQKTEEGKPIYKEIDTKKSTYSRDLGDIFAFIFGQVPKGNEKQIMHSFVGLLKLMEKYLDKDTIKMIFSSFLRIIWEKGQEIEVTDQFNKEGIQEKDFEVKKAAYDQFIKVFPYLKMKDEALKNFVMPFYVDLKAAKERRKAKEAAAAKVGK